MPKKRPGARFPSVFTDASFRGMFLLACFRDVNWIESGNPPRASDSCRTLALAKSGVSAPVILPCQNDGPKDLAKASEGPKAVQNAQPIHQRGGV